MIKKVFLIIGLWIAIGALAPTLAHAQDLPSSNCARTLYDNEFVCDSAAVRSFCSTTAMADETPDALVNTSSSLSFYKSSYCNLQRQDEGDIYEVVADQMNAEEPGWDEDLVKETLTGISGASLLEIAGGTEGLNELPPTLVETYINNPNFGGQSKIFAKVKAAYDAEKVMAKKKSSLKQEFKAREMWANGSLSDAPFDLIVDLNLVEIVLFGSEAKWMDDVYTFPKQGGSQGGEPTEGGASAETSGSVAQGGQEDQGGTTTGSGEVSVQPQQIECVPAEGNGEVPGTEGPGIEIIPPGQVPVNCGNGKVDAGEECDDKNATSGDGCTEACKNEPGNTLACMDPQAVTFKPFVPKPVPSRPGATESPSGNVQTPTPTNPPQEEIPIDCPPGSAPSTGEKPVIQPLSYLGPNILGVLKEFPPSKKPTCPEGMSEYGVTFNSKDTSASASASGDETLGISVAGTSYTVPRCIPTSFCADFEAARELLFGENYKEDKSKAEVAAAIEAFICVKVIKENRPESPYPVNEGCVDCHVLAMSDIMGKLLEKNVACLENNQQAWGLSNRWGPGLSFNLDVVSQMGTNALRKKLGGEPSDLTPAEKAELASRQMLQDASHQYDPNRDQSQATVSADLEASKILSQTLNVKQEAENDIRQALGFFHATAEARVVDQESHGQISEMLRQMLNRFSNLQTLYLSISTGVKFHEKEECKFN